ncbi:MAG: zinc ribbon-containing protein [Chromatiales bacterium]|jgi:polyhydroxyalkanoate synthesis regulator phasin|nr:zinc ribbon-containing protein [Chromatiales bacterium]MDX9768439.1 zinc ribbon-containing protein [Ectothiorhodospiraceae bacterium]
MSDADNTTPPPERDRLAEAYDRMMERVRHTMEAAGEQAHTLEQALHEAGEKAVHLGEITREEAANVADYVRRDAEEMAQYLNETGKDMRAWLRMDLELIEARMLELIASVADRTRVELAQFAERAREASYRHTGEITGPGVLECTECGEHLHFTRTGRIPPCPKCKATRFRRVREK